MQSKVRVQNSELNNWISRIEHTDEKIKCWQCDDSMADFPLHIIHERLSWHFHRLKLIRLSPWWQTGVLRERRSIWTSCKQIPSFLAVPWGNARYALARRRWRPSVLVFPERKHGSHLTTHVPCNDVWTMCDGYQRCLGVSQGNRTHRHRAFLLWAYTNITVRKPLQS